jgi:hypothetical protein
MQAVHVRIMLSLLMLSNLVTPIRNLQMSFFVVRE